MLAECFRAMRPRKYDSTKYSRTVLDKKRGKHKFLSKGGSRRLEYQDKSERSDILTTWLFGKCSHVGGFSSKSISWNKILRTYCDHGFIYRSYQHSVIQYEANFNAPTIMFSPKVKHRGATGYLTLQGGAADAPCETTFHEGLLWSVKAQVKKQRLAPPWRRV